LSEGSGPPDSHLVDLPAISSTPRPGNVRLVEWLLHWGPLPCAFGVVGLSLVKYGAGLYPSWRYMQAIAENWRHPMVSHLLAPPADYLLDSPVSAVAAGILPLTSGRAFIAFHLVLACVAIAVPFALSAVRRSPELRVGVSLLIVGGAVPAALLSWVGSYDPVSIGGAAVGALASNPLVRAFGWMLFAFNNAGEAVIALAVYVVILWVARGRSAFPAIVISGLAVVAGYVGIRVLTAAWGGGESEFTMMKYYGFSQYLRGYGYWPLVALSALGVGWLLLVDPEVRHLRVAQVFFGLSLLAAMGMPLIALDTSRVTAGVLYPGMLASAQIIFGTLGNVRTRIVLAHLAPVALLLVIVLAWSDKLVYAGWRSLLHIVHYLLGGPTPST
jgi:hypothetical protein